MKNFWYVLYVTVHQPAMIDQSLVNQNHSKKRYILSIMRVIHSCKIEINEKAI